MLDQNSNEVTGFVFSTQNLRKIGVAKGTDVSWSTSDSLSDKTAGCEEPAFDCQGSAQNAGAVKAKRELQSARRAHHCYENAVQVGTALGVVPHT